jgi:hypothetical protein
MGADRILELKQRAYTCTSVLLHVAGFVSAHEIPEKGSLTRHRGRSEAPSRQA